MTVRKSSRYDADCIVFVGREFDEIAKNLFKALRDFDSKDVDVILAEGVEDKDLGLAIMNRLRKAAFRIIKV